MYGKDFLKRDNVLSVESDFFGNLFFLMGITTNMGTPAVELIRGVFHGSRACHDTAQ